jgi:hypothetical protein
MQHSRFFKAAILLTVGLAAYACGEEGSLTTAPRDLDLAAKPAPFDISGDYVWSETGKGLISEEFAEAFFGIQPEGKVTHATCQNQGTFTLVQNGTSFSGEATQTGTCVTRGGQVFDNTFPFPFPILNGRITGRSIHFDFSDPICPYVGVLQIAGGQVVGVRGTGRCGPIGPRDHFKTIGWEATRIG